MKKQNSIVKYIAKTAFAMAFIASLCACTDDYTTTNNYIEEGIPVEISMKCAKPAMTDIATRGLNPNEEEQVNDLYIFIFNENGTERKEGSRLYTKDAIKDGKITLQTTSGNSRIFAIANVQNNQQQDLRSTLDGIKKVDDLEKACIEMSLKNGFIDVERTSPNLVMSGAFEGNTVNKPTGYCPITTEPKQDFTGKGEIKLIHFDSHIKFRIRTGEKVTKFEPKTWQVLNVPKQSYLIERNKQNAGTTDDNYGNSTVYNNQNFLVGKNENQEDIQTFEFYQFENFKNSKNGIADAKDREKEVKTGGKNTGEFYYVDPHATYVEFTAYIELVEDGIQRIADVKFTVLLGGKDSSTDTYHIDNFNTWRNKKYTYDVTINGVSDITTEVGVEDGTYGTESRPGIEGDVIDANGEVRILDAHYNCFNIALTKKQVEGMSILIHTPFDEIEYDAKDNTKNQRPTVDRDYKWIKFKRRPNSIVTDHSQPLAQYGVSGVNVDDDATNGRLDIYNLRKDVMKQAGGENDLLYYTVFVDEYYYDKHPKGEDSWGNNSRTYWTHFVNKDPRYMMLVYTPKKSEDGESSWSKARYFIRQKSIQTYYSTTNLTQDGTALGMEHVNESEKANRTVYDLSRPLDVDNGFRNCSKFFSEYDVWGEKGNMWKTFVEYRVTTDTRHTNTVNMTKAFSHAQCLSRNRDKNGNGIIDANETEWYLPTFNQISGMYLGAASLSSPLFTPSSIIPKYDDENYHFATSDADKIWAQEGCSNNGPESTLNNMNIKANEVRCVRNLGLTAKDSESKVPQLPYKTDEGGHYVFDMKYIESSNLRKSQSIRLGFHENFKDSRNKPYHKFELAKEFMSSSKLPANSDTWGIYRGYENAPGYDLNGKDLCEDYFEGTETDSQRGKKRWRTPNQRELLIIYNGLRTKDKDLKEMIYTENGIGYGMLSCTYWQYDNWTNTAGKGYRIFAIYPEDKHLFLDNGYPENNRHSKSGTILRCVRDID